MAISEETPFLPKKYHEQGHTETSDGLLSVLRLLPLRRVATGEDYLVKVRAERRSQAVN